MSARILFYVIQQKSEREALQFACHLIEKIVKQGLRVAVVSGDESKLMDYDALLWRFKPESFVTHTAANNTLYSHAQVVLHRGDEAIHPLDVWFSLSDTAQTGLLSFSRIVHIIRNDEETKIKARAQFKYYRDLGLTPETISI